MQITKAKVTKLPPHNPENKKTFNKYRKVSYQMLNRPRKSAEDKIISKIDNPRRTSDTIPFEFTENEIGKLWRGF